VCALYELRLRVKYRFLIDKPDYSDFASGKVLLGLPGRVATPLRLVDELFQNALDILRANGLSSPVTVYDPCCGTAYHLAALAYLHWQSIAAIFASDVNADVLAIAKQNLLLLSLDGIDLRIRNIRQMYERFGKSSHREALEAAGRLRQILEANVSHEIRTFSFSADAFDSHALIRTINQNEIAIVLADTPYGLGSHWESPLLASTPEIADSQVVIRLLDSLLPTLLPRAVVCLLASKAVKISPVSFKPIRRIRAGKRSAIILQRVV
jgi:SAM-dependent methyltransferase